MTGPLGGGPAELAISNTRVIDFTSSINGRAYRLQIGLPLLPPPAAGYRPFFLFDGNSYSASAIECVRSNLNAPDVLVVGIGYPETESFVKVSCALHGPPRDAMEAGLPPFLLAVIRERLFDLTLPTDEDGLARDYDFGGAPRDVALVGGLENFLETIVHDVVERISDIAPINAAGSALFGHSAGGLAVLHALFTRPAMVRTFVAASPSIWLGGSAVLEREPAFAAAVESGAAAPRILVTMGAEESTLPRNLPLESAEAMMRMIQRANMVENGARLVERLRTMRGRPGYEVADYALFPAQQHGISVWPALGRAVEYAFQRPPASGE